MLNVWGWLSGDIVVDSRLSYQLGLVVASIGHRAVNLVREVDMVAGALLPPEVLENDGLKRTVLRGSLLLFGAQECPTAVRERHILLTLRHVLEVLGHSNSTYLFGRSRCVVRSHIIIPSKLLGYLGRSIVLDPTLST